MADNSEFLFLDEVARRCRVPVSTVRYWIAEAKLPSGRFARRRMVRIDDLERFIAAGFQARPATATPSSHE
jgi:excisionase family DNA binding protein